MKIKTNKVIIILSILSMLLITKITRIIAQDISFKYSQNRKNVQDTMLGKWQIFKYKFCGLSSLDKTDSDKLKGSILMYSEDSLNVFDFVGSKVEYSYEFKSSAGYFSNSFKCNYKELGVPGRIKVCRINYLAADIKKKMFMDVIVLDGKKIIVPYEGVFFYAKKIK